MWTGGMLICRNYVRGVCMYVYICRGPDAVLAGGVVVVVGEDEGGLAGQSLGRGRVARNAWWVGGLGTGEGVGGWVGGRVDGGDGE